MSGLLTWLTDGLGLTDSGAVAKNQKLQQQSFDQSSQYRNEAAGLFGNLAGMGANEYQLGSQNVSPLLALFASAAGIDPSLLNLGTSYQVGGGPGSATGPGNALAASLEGHQAGVAGGGSNVGAGSAAANALNAGGGGGGLAGAAQTLTGANRNQRQPGGAGAGAQGAGAAAGGASPAASFDPYALTAPQQTQLNQQLDTIARQQQTAESQLQASFAQHGITDSGAQQAAITQLRENFASLSSGTSANFYETARQQKEQAAASLLSTALGMEQSGMSAYGAGAQGIAGLGGQSLSASGQAGQSALDYTKIGNDQTTGLLNLLGFALGGGFNKTKTGGGGGSSGGGSTNPTAQTLSNANASGDEVNLLSAILASGGGA